MREEAVREFGVAADRLREQGRIDDFIKVGERLLWHKQDATSLARELSSIYLERGDPKRALAKLQQCFQADPRDVETLALLAKAFQTIGQLPKTISVYKEMARLFASRGEDGKRREVLEAIIAIAPDDPEANQELYAGTSQPDPNYPPAYSPAPPPAVTFSPVPQHPEAYAQHQPLDPQPLTILDDGGRVSPPALPSEPDQADYYVEESEAFEVDDAFVEEVHEVEEFDPLVVVDGPQDRGSEISRLMTETDVFVKYGLHDKAIEHLQKVFELEPLHIEARERLKDIYVQLGETGHAVAELVYLADLYGEANPQASIYYLQEALSVVPGHPDVLERMQRLGVDVEAGEPPAQEQAYEPNLAEYDEPKELLLNEDDLEPVEEAEEPAVATEPTSTDEPTIDVLPGEPSPAGSNLEEELEEVDFFIQQGLMDEALAMLRELREQAPTHPLVAEKLAEFEGSPSEQEETLLDQSFDLSSHIPEELEGGQSGPTREDEVKDVFEQFKRGVAQQIDAGDADTHFDLGVAYKEMGLIDDAIAEFEIARESPEREAIAQTMIGHCYMQGGQSTDAINAFKRGLYAEHKTTTEELDLYYELGNAYLSLSDPKEALYYFQKVAKRSPDFRDVRTHIAAIEADGLDGPTQDAQGGSQ
jgi:tetratricopeptide (TPR) repeat protein